MAMRIPCCFFACLLIAILFFRPIAVILATLTPFNLVSLLFIAVQASLTLGSYKNVMLAMAACIVKLLILFRNRRKMCGVIILLLI
jgi:hypothetical protein